jgi:hypothetical protein
MSYKITYSYNWYKTNNERFIIKTYHINSIPFTFDELPSIAQDDPEIIKMSRRATYIITRNILSKIILSYR